jgi:hypothetical protein
MYRQDFASVEVVSLSTLIEAVIERDWPIGTYHALVSENINLLFYSRYNVSISYTTHKHRYTTDNGLVYAVVSRAEYLKAKVLTGLKLRIYLWWLAFKNVKGLI